MGIAVGISLLLGISILYCCAAARTNYDREIDDRMQEAYIQDKQKTGL